ncbi:uncharacterized protein NPIL_65791, partial [Nephila pilipes]
MEFRFFFDILTEVGTSQPEVIADYGTRSMVQNFKYFTPNSIIRVYATLAAYYLSFKEVLTQDNSRELALQYASIIKTMARDNIVQGEPTSKFPVIKNSFLEFLTSIDTLTPESALMLAISYEIEWILVAVETDSSNDLYTKCISDANGDFGESKSDWDTHSLESDDRTSGTESQSSESSESISSSGSRKSESDETTSGTDSNSSESSESNISSDSRSSDSSESSSATESN